MTNRNKNNIVTDLTRCIFGDDGGETDDLRPRSHDDEQLQLPVFFPVN